MLYFIYLLLFFLFFSNSLGAMETIRCSMDTTIHYQKDTSIEPSLAFNVNLFLFCFFF